MKSSRFLAVGLLTALFLCPCLPGTAELRPESHQQYAQTLWDFIQARSYQKWSPAAEPVQLKHGPSLSQGRQYLNGVAEQSISSQREGALIVAEHLAADDETVIGITVWRKSQSGFDSATDDWYWVHYTPSGQVAKTSADKSHYSKPGFVAFEEEGRLWVFGINSPELAGYLGLSCFAPKGLAELATQAGETRSDFRRLASFVARQASRFSAIALT